MNAATTLDRPVFVQAKDVPRFLGIGKTRLYELMQEPGFPRPISIAGNRKSFVVAELLEWAARRIAARDEAA
jgi:predicted DNA-binding transcriptional regulator AlpA